MPRLLALEWNDVEARVAVASSRAGRAVVEHAFSVSLRPEPRAAAQAEGEPGAAAAKAEPKVDVGRRLAAALAARRIGRLDALVALGRASVELRQMVLPPAAEADLPDLVRLQAVREFANLGDDWPLDFVPLDEGLGQARNVLAAALDPAVMHEVEAVCQPAGLKPRKFLLRPCGAASLLVRTAAVGRARVRLLADVLVDEADLTVMIDRRVIFMRTARLPGDPLSDAEAAAALVGEVRRTMVASQNQLGGSPVEAVFLCGSGREHADLARQISAQLAVPTELFDPFAGLALEGDLARALPDHPGRFAPLLGLLLDELDGVPQTLDFLHPRRRPPPPSQISRLIAGGVAVAVLVVAVALVGLWQVLSLDSQIRDLQSESASLDRKVTEAAKVEKTAGEIRKWTAGDVVWLDELRRMSERFPPSQDAMLTQLQMLSGQAGSDITMEGLARNVEAVKTMEEKVQDTSRRMVSKDKSEDTSLSPYSLRFRSTLVISPKERR